MVPNMGTMDMSMSHDCHDDMSSDMDMADHCESEDMQHKTCDSKNCGACVYHCSNAVFSSLKSPIADGSPLLETQHLPSETLSFHSRMLRPPRAA